MILNLQNIYKDYQQDKRQAAVRFKTAQYRVCISEFSSDAERDCGGKCITAA